MIEVGDIVTVGNGKVHAEVLSGDGWKTTVRFIKSGYIETYDSPLTLVRKKEKEMNRATQKVVVSKHSGTRYRVLYEDEGGYLLEKWETNIGRFWTSAKQSYKERQFYRIGVSAKGSGHLRYHDKPLPKGTILLNKTSVGYESYTVDSCNKSVQPPECHFTLKDWVVVKETETLE